MEYAVTCAAIALLLLGVWIYQDTYLLGALCFLCAFFLFKKPKWLRILCISMAVLKLIEAIYLAV